MEAELRETFEATLVERYAGPSEAFWRGLMHAFEQSLSPVGAVEAAVANTLEQQPERTALALPRPIKNSAVVWLKFHGGRWWGKNRDGAEFDDYLSDAWVNENFAAWFLDVALAAPGQWRKIPEGKEGAGRADRGGARG